MDGVESKARHSLKAGPLLSFHLTPISKDEDNVLCVNKDMEGRGGGEQEHRES